MVKKIKNANKLRKENKIKSNKIAKDKELDKRLKDTFPASDSTAKY